MDTGGERETSREVVWRCGMEDKGFKAEASGAFTGAEGDRFQGLLKEAGENLLKSGAKCETGLVVCLDTKGRLWFEWTGKGFNALSMLERIKHEVNKWLDDV